MKERHDTELTVVEVDMREGDHHDHVAHKRHLETFLKFFEEVGLWLSVAASGCLPRGSGCWGWESLICSHRWLVCSPSSSPSPSRLHYPPPPFFSR